LLKRWPSKPDFGKVISILENRTDRTDDNTTDRRNDKTPMIDNLLRWLGVLSLILPSSIVAFEGVVVASTTISFGETASGAISVSGEEDVFTFSAAAGDVVLAQMAATSGNLNPSIRIINGDGDTLCSHESYADPAEIERCELPETGTYTLRAADYDGGDTGNYQIHLQRLNNPGNATSMAFDDTLSGSIGSSADLDAYTFNGASGDLLVARMTNTSGDIMPEVRVYDPDGSLLCQHNSYGSALVTGCGLPADGDYTVLVGDYWGKYTGAYNVYLQKLNDPAGAATLPIAEVKPGSIVAAAEMNAYTFAGSVGDSLIIRGNTTSAGGLMPHLRLYDPNGTLVCSDYGSLYDIAEIVNCTMATAGEHTLLVSDHAGGNVGNYDVHLTRINDPVNAESIPYAETQVGQTSHAVQLQTYTFTGRASDVVVAQAAVPAQTFAPHLRLYSENGTLICQDYAFTSFSEDAAWTHCTLPQDDTYVIVVGGYASASERGPGTYHLFLQRLTPAVASRGIRFDTSQSSSIAQAGEIDTYTFRAASGDVVTLQMSAAGDTIDPYLHLYGIDGVKLGEDYDTTWVGDGLAEIADCTLPFSGTYTLLASDYGANETGDYTLYLNCEGDSCGFPLVLDKKLYLPVTIK
jgi:hypothetical protein